MAEREAKSTDSSAPDAKPSANDDKTSEKSRASKEAHAAVLQADLNKLEARLKRADTLTRNSVESLETIVNALETRLKTHKSSQKGQLTRQVNALTSKLEDTVSETRQTIRNDLRKALAQGASDTQTSLSVLEAAIARSTAKVDEAELAQADAITRINRHMADMARAVDARIENEAKARRQDIEGVQARLDTALKSTKTELETRVGTIERDSANALIKVGEKIEVLHDRLESRRDSDTDAVALKVKSLARQTEADFEAYRERLETRILELETRQDMLTVRTVGKEESEAEKERDRASRAAINAQLIALQKRIDDMEQARRQTEAATIAAASAAAAQAQARAQAELQSVTSIPGATYAPASDAPLTLTQPDAPPHREPTSFAETGPDQQGDREEGDHVPVEFNPYAFAAETSQPAQPSNILPFGQNEPPPLPGATPTVPPPPPQTLVEEPTGPARQFQDISEGNGLGSPPIGDLDMGGAQTGPLTFEPAPLPDAPYENPAYAETDTSGHVHIQGHDDDGSPKAVRITDDKPRKRRLTLPRGPSGMTGRTLRIALLATGVTVVGLIAGKMVLGTDDVPMPGNTRDVLSPLSGAPDQAAVDPNRQSDAIVDGPQTQPQGTVDAGSPIAPIGDYPERAPIQIDANQIDTLEAAVEAGNPIAQFQMGIARLENGETQEGARLIRLAADAGQPVARYRLAKLHEAGVGVEQNDERARQLIEQAARDGHRIAMHDLALYYAEGRGGVDLDMATAQSWFEQAAQRGVLDSQYNLAVLSEAPDTGLRPDPETAYFWYSVAARQGDQFAVNRRDMLASTFEADTLTALNRRVENFAPREIDEQANGIFRDLPWLQGSETPRADAENQVRNAQILLAELGFDVGTADGQVGQRTRSAIMAFERANGLPQTGRINSELITRLERAAGA